MSRRLAFILAAFGLALAIAGAARAQVPAVIEGKDIMPYLNQMIDWQRRLSLLEMPTELPRLQIIRNTLHQHAAKAVAASFSAAREIAETLPPPPAETAADGSAAKGHNLQKAIANATQQVHDFQTALAQARSAPRRAALDGQLKLAQEHLSLIKTIATAVGAKDEDNDTLDAQITKLSETMPESDGGTGKQAVITAASAAAPPAEAGAAGVIADLYDYIKQSSRSRPCATKPRPCWTTATRVPARSATWCRASWPRAPKSARPAWRRRRRSPT